MTNPSPSAIAYVRTEEAPEMPPPRSERGVLHWLWVNVFASMANFSTPAAAIQSVAMMVATVGVGYFGVTQIIALTNFALFDAIWDGSGAEKRLACATIAQGGELPQDWFGACYPYVSAKWQFLIYGFYPTEEIWRVNWVYLIGALGVAYLTMSAVPHRRIVGVVLIAAGVGFAFLTADLYGEQLGARVGAQILVGIGLIYALAPENAPMRIIGILMLTIYPLFAFVMLTGGGIEMSSRTLGIWIAVTLALFGFGILGGRGALGEVGVALSSIANSLGAVIAGAVVVMAVASVDFGLTPVATDQWGGLLVTLVVAVAGIVFSLPLGILLALGRRSSLPAVRILSIAFIEFWRGVPLITVLFFSSVMLPLFLPQGVDFDKLLRALIGVMFFSAAYQAEVVRGGLQAIPKGQYEGAMALGLSYWKMMRLIILPQALTLVIPGIVNTFIGLFKDTTLVLIISIFDLLGAMQSSLTDASWATPVQAPTGYFVIAAMFFVFCFGMSRYSMYLERQLRRGHAR